MRCMYHFRELVVILKREFLCYINAVISSLSWTVTESQAHRSGRFTEKLAYIFLPPCDIPVLTSHLEGMKRENSKNSDLIAPPSSVRLTDLDFEITEKGLKIRGKGRTSSDLQKLGSFEVIWSSRAVAPKTILLHVQGLMLQLRFGIKFFSDHVRSEQKTPC